MTKRTEQVGIMKATGLEEKLVARLGPTCFAQPKFRGQRARTIWLDEDTPILLSSQGNPFMFLEHIQAELKLLPRLPYDGELYIHSPEWTQQRINSVLNRTVNRSPDHSLFEYHIFDLATEERQGERLCRIAEIRPAEGHIRLADTYRMQTKNWTKRCECWVSCGYEGIILRARDGLYSPLDHTARYVRSRDVLKFKPNELDEYEIIGFKEGIEEGWTAGMLGAFEVRRFDGGPSFFVGTGPELTKSKRIRYWNEREQLLGATLVVKHEKNICTADGIPICTVAMEVRRK